MGKLQQFEISLNNNKEVYSPGESISGTVKISATESLQCKAIKVNCHGFCGVTNKVHDTSWDEEEQYFNSSLSVADKGTLKQGEHSFPFKFLIPATAPTSFEGPYGKIIYKIRAFVDTPRFSKDYKAEKQFSMKNKINLNKVPDIFEPNCATVSKNFTYMLVKNGTVNLAAKVDKRGYISGQVIKVSAEIDNQSGKTTGHVVASLIQKVTYHTKKATNDLRTIAEVEGGEVKGGKQTEWKDQIIIPPLPQSDLAGCNLIEISYFVQVSLKYPEMALTLPIQIGHVALDPSLCPPPKATKASKTTPAPVPRTNPSSPPSVKVHAAAEHLPSASPSLPPRSFSPSLPPRPTPRPRSMCVTPSAPPAELGMLSAGDQKSEEMLAKSHSQHQGPVSPTAFSYAPGLVFPQNNSTPLPPQFPQSTGASNSFFTNGNGPPMPTSSSPFIMPPEYRSSPHPQEPPPAYEDNFLNT